MRFTGFDSAHVMQPTTLPDSVTEWYPYINESKRSSPFCEAAAVSLRGTKRFTNVCLVTQESVDPIRKIIAVILLDTPSNPYKSKYMFTPCNYHGSTYQLHRLNAPSFMTALRPTYCRSRHEFINFNPRTTEGGGYHPPVFSKRHIFSVQCFQKCFRIPLGYSLSHLLVNKFQKHFAPRWICIEKSKVPRGGGYHPPRSQLL